MAISKALFSTDITEWETPDALFDELNAEFKFVLDAAASHENRKCDVYITEGGVHEIVDGKMLWTSWADGLTANWYGIAEAVTGQPFPAVWLNPPYSRDVGKWVAKCYEESRKGCIVVALLAARTDTKWFHEFIYNKPKHDVEVRFIKGRLRFKGAKGPAPFPSMIVIFHP